LGGEAALISAGAGARLEQIADLVSAQRGPEQAALFKALRERVPAFAAALREALFSFDKLRFADAKGIQKLIAQVERRRLIVALRGADPEVAEVFYRQLSRRAAAELQEEIGLLGPTRKSEVETAQREIASLAESLQRAGELSIVDPKQAGEWVP
ncbi:MAG: FliG C-terminal domain-containing protein, partial [Myxococcota bacterium]|nr:FliG C-terminal domain-containing protein [Myxococcota bacterium]